jgi:hypothetical protein
MNAYAAGNPAPAAPPAYTSPYALPSQQQNIQPAQPQAPAPAPSYAQPGYAPQAAPNPYQNAYNFPPNLPVGPPTVDPAKQPEYANLYINKDRRYFILFPPNWIKMNSKKNFDVMYLAPPNPGNPRSFAFVSVITLDVPLTMDLFAFVEKNIKNLSDHAQGFNLVASSPTNLNGVPAKAITYNYADYVSSYTVRQFFMVYNSVAYIITCSSSVNAFNHYDPTFNRIVASFQIFQ